MGTRDKQLSPVGCYFIFHFALFVSLVKLSNVTGMLLLVPTIQMYLSNITETLLLMPTIYLYVLLYK